jgi:hypothetical protein
LSKTIEIIVSPTGETRIETKGFQGASCQDASRLFEQALGAKTSESLTAEYYQKTPAAQEIQQGGRA